MDENSRTIRSNGCTLVVLFIGAGIFLFPHFDPKQKSSYAQLIFLGCSLGSLVQFNTSINHFWIRDEIDNKIYPLLESKAGRTSQPNVISGSRYFDRIYFFQNSLRGNRLPTYDFETWPNDKADFLLLTAYDQAHFPKMYSAYRELYTDPNSGTRLYERRKRVGRHMLKRIYKQQGADSLEFLEIANLPIDSSFSRNSIFDVDCVFRFQGSGESFSVAGSVFDKQGQVLLLKEQFHLNQLKSDWDNFHTTHFSVPFFKLPPEAAEIRLYIYNDKKVAHGPFKTLTTVWSLE